MNADPAALALRVAYLEKQNRALKLLFSGTALFFALVWTFIFWPGDGIMVFSDPAPNLVRFDHSPPSKSREAQQHFLNGLIFYQKGDYAHARDEWKRALRTDPKMTDARSGLERIAMLYGL